MMAPHINVTAQAKVQSWSAQLQNAQGSLWLTHLIRSALKVTLLEVIESSEQQESVEDERDAAGH